MKLPIIFQLSIVGSTSIYENNKSSDPETLKSCDFVWNVAIF